MIEIVASSEWEWVQNGDKRGFWLREKGYCGNLIQKMLDIKKRPKV